jgi:hypothetical protein
MPWGFMSGLLFSKLHVRRDSCPSRGRHGRAVHYGLQKTVFKAGTVSIGLMNSDYNWMNSKPTAAHVARLAFAVGQPRWWWLWAVSKLGVEAVKVVGGISDHRRLGGSGTAARWQECCLGHERSVGITRSRRPKAEGEMTAGWVVTLNRRRRRWDIGRTALCHCEMTFHWISTLSHRKQFNHLRTSCVQHSTEACWLESRVQTAIFNKKIMNHMYYYFFFFYLSLTSLKIN